MIQYLLGDGVAHYGGRVSRVSLPRPLRLLEGPDRALRARQLALGGSRRDHTRRGLSLLSGQHGRPCQRIAPVIADSPRRDSLDTRRITGGWPASRTPQNSGNPTPAFS